VPFLCQTSGKVVGVIGFEPTTPSSRTAWTPANQLILLGQNRRKTVNKEGNKGLFCADAVPTERDRLEALLRVAAAQWAHKSAADQEIERRFIARDFAAFEADLRAKQEPLGADLEKVLSDNIWELYAR
jgi:hypothetical protein